MEHMEKKEQIIVAISLLTTLVKKSKFVWLGTTCT